MAVAPAAAAQGRRQTHIAGRRLPLQLPNSAGLRVFMCCRCCRHLQMCQKQCRDENGFKCHLSSEGHKRQMEIFGQNPERIIDG